MCNLGEGIWERGVEAGIQTGIQQGQMQIVVQLLRNGTISVETGAEMLKKSTEEMKQICEEAGGTLNSGS